eukprot:gene6176-7690_t
MKNYNILVLIIIFLQIFFTVSYGFKVFKDPDDTLSFIELVNSNGYPCEEHFVVTKDGYILRMFRIPYGKNHNSSNRKQPVLLQHGLLDSSFTWIINEPGESLSYILADQGYDVWMGNNRGNFYSTNHTTLSVKSHEFWKFSFDEMGKYDLPAMVDYIIENTGFQSLPYVGHSEGTTQAFISYLVDNSISEKIPLFFALGPVGNVTNITNKPLRGLADYNISQILKIFGYNKFMPQPTLLRGLFIEFCEGCEYCCSDVIQMICGPHKGAFNDSRMPVIAGHEPAGTSIQNIQHWSQGVTQKQFQMFNYGPTGNLLSYNQTNPPIYSVNKISNQVKMVLFSGTVDELADPLDVQSLLSELPMESILEWQVIPGYAHLDYVWALDASQIIYPKIINYIHKFYPSN